MPPDLMSYFSLKRFLDFLLAFFLVIGLLPIILVGSTISAIVLREWPIYRQDRVGKGGVSFRILKIKTMKTGMNHVIDHVLIEAMRKSGIDELPQLINVLKGEMSFVGPRPLPVHYQKFIKHEHLVRENVMPGITGLAQVSGGNELSWQERFDLDVRYVQGRTPLLDLRILINTVKVVFSKRRTSSDVLSKDY
jgi:undecaprenyl phosphate N,N'-diacetylbacillosamine 1-phosphate transferase